MKNVKYIIVALVVMMSVVSCGDKRTPNLQYMPEMYVSVPYDANNAEGINGKPSNLVPVEGTIARGNVPYEYEDTNEGYELAKTTLKNPLEASEENLENGKKMYAIYCAVCHSKTGDGNGILAQREKFSGVPNYKDRDLTEGNIYHVIMYGRNLMGSHASQLTTKERWQVVSYVEKLRNDLLN